MELYNKSPLTYTEQIELLKSRGMIIPNEKRTERHLANISYYRLSAYMLPYKQSENGVFLILSEIMLLGIWCMICMFLTGSCVYWFSMP